MGSRMNYIFIWCLLASIFSSDGCSMEGVTTWQLPITLRIEDYFDGIVLQRTVSDIGGFTLTSSSDLNGGPYIVASIENSNFVLRTNDAYRLFEEYETVDLISLTYAFTCTNGQTPSSPLTFRIEINDNNNNAPLFRTPDTAASETTTYDFTIATPVPPGFLITNCVSDIIVRDIDLTTYRIDFGIEDNPYIGIELDEAASTEAKEYKAVLRSTTFIRSIPEPITLTISATDVDLTGDPPITRSTTVTIHGSSEFEMPLEPVFTQAFYLASYTENDQVTASQPITLEQGYDELVQFSLDGDYAADHFGITVDGNLVTLTVTNPLPTSTLQEGQIYLIVRVAREYTSGASATIVVQLPEAENLEFERPHYEGVIVDNVLQLPQLVLSQGYQGSDLNVTVEDYSSFFAASVVGNTITLSMTPLDDIIIQDNNFINLRVTASTDNSAATTIVSLEIVKDDVTTPVFEHTLYTGTYDPTAGLTVDPLLLVRGYDDTVNVSLSGEYESYFELIRDGPSSTLRVAGDGLPAHILGQTHLHLSVEAAKPRTVGASAVVAITLPGDTESVINEAFDKVLYEGSINVNVVQHESITITGHAAGINIEIFGVYRELFSATVSGDTVVIGAAGTLNLPEGVTHVALELRAGSASAVVIFDVTQSETPELPTVLFGSPSYVLRADMAQTGVLGQVQATASNGENIAYSLAVDDAHLRERISINSVGEIHLSASTNTGVYSFEAIATSTITQIQATAAVQLIIEAATICGDDHALPPLIILDRDEEEPHTNLVVLDSVAEAGCQFRITNRWPLDQDWLYVDETGLHANRIDREDPRIAFMALSQVQVELVLECANDTQSRIKRSTVTPRLDWLGPYEYGSNKWILTDTILYNSRRSFVNLIVNDINDNYPIFVGNENRPVICGYPVPELEDIVLPRALAELKATDADVGENAALYFWSSSDALAVASSTGFVHVRDGASLSQDQTLTVSVTDLNGREGGLTTSIELLVKLLDTSHIAVVTVRNAFLDQEESILGNLSSAVGYEVKVLSSAVISDDPADSANARRKRQVTTDGASLQLYVYGVINREPVAVSQLTIDITENVSGVDVTSTVSLEDYLEGREIYRTGRDTGLLVATIVLSILLFILMLLIALWFFLRWRKARNYEKFSDANSLASRNEPIESPPKVDSLRKPRLNIDELKRSERRLQEMLDAPVDGGPKAQSSKVEPEQLIDTIINVPPSRSTDVGLPIVIQSIDKLKDDLNSEEEDEFGERKNKSRRKSVVTFNENVEKFIHVEDIPDDNSSDVEIFKF